MTCAKFLGFCVTVRAAERSHWKPRRVGRHHQLHRLLRRGQGRRHLAVPGQQLGGRVRHAGRCGAELDALRRGGSGLRHHAQLRRWLRRGGERLVRVAARGAGRCRGGPHQHHHPGSPPRARTVSPIVPSADLCTFMQARLTCASLRSVWFRNVFTETVRPARTCPADGGFAQWADGVTPAAVQPDQPPGPPSSGAERATAALLVGLAAAVVLV